MKTGLVLEGGAMRGLFTSGVLDVLMENGIDFDGVIGTSAGATFGCNFKSRQPGRVLRYNTRFCRNWRYCSLRSLILTGDLYGADFCYRKLPQELDLFDTATFAANPIEFWLTATDMETGEAVYHQCRTGDREDCEWMRASGSMPLVSRPVKLDGRMLSDGGTADSIPLKAFEDRGFARNVVVLTQPAGYVKQLPRAMPLLRVSLRRYPALLRKLEDRPALYNGQTAYVREREEAGAAFVIRPEAPLNIGAVCRKPEELKRVYLLGREAMEKRLTELKAFLDR